MLTLLHYVVVKTAWIKYASIGQAARKSTQPHVNPVVSFSNQVTTT